jgi:predicted secreted protein
MERVLSFEAFMVVTFWIVIFWVLTLNIDFTEEHVSIFMVKVCRVRNQLHYRQVVMLGTTGRRVQIEHDLEQ